MRLQMAFIAALSLSAIVAVPFFYEHRFNGPVFAGGMIAFIGVPLVVGIADCGASFRITLYPHGRAQSANCSSHEA